MPQYQRLITIVKYFNLNQSDFAKELGISQSKVSKVQAGTQKITPEIFGAIIERFNVNPLWLLGKIGSNDKIVFNEDVVPKEELEKEKQEKYKLMEELLMYKSRENEELKTKNRVEAPVSVTNT